MYIKHYKNFFTRDDECSCLKIISNKKPYTIYLQKYINDL